MLFKKRNKTHRKVQIIKMGSSALFDKSAARSKPTLEKENKRRPEWAQQMVKNLPSFND